MLKDCYVLYLAWMCEDCDGLTQMSPIEILDLQEAVRDAKKSLRGRKIMMTASVPSTADTTSSPTAIEVSSR